MQHRYTSLLASSALILAMVLAPTASFAAAFGQENGQGANHAAAAAITAHASSKGQQGKSSSSSDNNNREFFGSLASFFGVGTKVALADTGADTDTNTTTTTQSTHAMPPVISGVSSPTVLAVGASGTWSVSASDPQNGSLSYAVDWGDQAMHPLSFAAMQQTFVQTASFTHAYAAAGTYTVKFTVKDDAGLTSASTVTVHVTGSEVQPLALSTVNATSSTPTHAAITWKTNVRSDSTVFYSTGTPVDTSTALSTSISANVLNHRIPLNRLSPGTTYYFVVQSKDVTGEVATSTESSFKTPTLPNKAPSIQSVTGPTTIVVTTAGTWTVNASDPQNSTLSYSIDWGDTPLMVRAMALVAPQQVFTQTSTFTHTYANPGTYTVTVTAKDTAGLTATATTSVAVTPAPVEPVLSNVSVGPVSATGATLTWNTDETADSAVWIGTTSPDTSLASIKSDTTEVTSHSLAVSGLSASTTYFAIVGSRDLGGNLAVSSVISFTTAPAITAPTLSDITATVGSDSIVFNWNTNEGADSEVYYASTAPVVVGGTGTTPITDAALATNHSLSVKGLSAGTTYYFLIQSKDANGKTTSTSQFSLTTMSM